MQKFYSLGARGEVIWNLYVYVLTSKTSFSKSPLMDLHGIKWSFQKCIVIFSLIPSRQMHGANIKRCIILSYNSNQFHDAISSTFPNHCSESDVVKKIYIMFYRYYSNVFYCYLLLFCTNYLHESIYKSNYAKTQYYF